MVKVDVYLASGAGKNSHIPYTFYSLFTYIKIRICQN